MRRWWMVFAVFVAVGVMAVPVGLLQAASAFAAPAFQQQWQQGEAITPNFWGPLGNAHDGQEEQYKEATGGMRLVQYFDKGRMELTNGKVTNGLLATELIKGQLQTGDATFQPLASPTIPIAGDPDNPGPTYASLATKASSLFDAAPSRVGGFAQAVVSSIGDISVSNDAATSYTTFALYDDTTKHNVTAPFATYRNSVGLPTIGLAISEPFTTMVKVGGKQTAVVVQVFERRVLTYTDSNPNAFKVEMGNIGQHYYQWRYGGGSNHATSVPTATGGKHVGPASFYPDPNLTPGDVFPGVTAQEVCVSGYSKGVRAVSSDEKAAVYQRYGIPNEPGKHEVDHFIPLELGGSNMVTNLWPEPYVTPDAPGQIGAHEKDKVENYLHAQVCNGSMTLAQAQEAIRSDWYAVYLKIA